MTHKDNKELAIKVGKKIREFRRERKLKQWELGVLMGWKRESAEKMVSFYETGKRFPYHYLSKFAKVLGKRMEDFLE